LVYAHEYFIYQSTTLSGSNKSILSKIVGLYQISYYNKSTGNRWTDQLVVMENAFCNFQINQTYDLKGSIRNRYVKTTDEEILHQKPIMHTLLDGNFLESTLGLPLPLDNASYNILMEAINSDTAFLCENNIVDYSLIVGLSSNANDQNPNSSKIVVVGIIDYLRQYDFIKRIESVGKSVSMIAGQAAPTIVQPTQYSKRFVDAMQQYFMPMPSSE